VIDRAKFLNCLLQRSQEQQQPLARRAMTVTADGFIRQFPSITARSNPS
jgi:hypothetical protein